MWSSAGDDYAKSQNLPYFETSAKTGEMVNTVYVELVRAMRVVRQAAAEREGVPTQKKRKRRCVIL